MTKSCGCHWHPLHALPDITGLWAKLQVAAAIVLILVTCTSDHGVDIRLQELNQLLVHLWLIAVFKLVVQHAFLVFWRRKALFCRISLISIIMSSMLYIFWDYILSPTCSYGFYGDWTSTALSRNTGCKNQDSDWYRRTMVYAMAQKAACWSYVAITAACKVICRSGEPYRGNEAANLSLLPATGLVSSSNHFHLSNCLGASHAGKSDRYRHPITYLCMIALVVLLYNPECWIASRILLPWDIELVPM